MLFSVLALYSYFTLFAPLLSARVIYDDGAQSRREVALSSPVKGRDLLIGNLLSNLAFYLPFFGLVGTLVLSPFIGSGKFSPFLTSILLFAVLSLLILIGLISGALISPLIYFFISTQKNEFSRALVTFLVSAMLITSLPLLRFLLDNVGKSDFGILSYLPFVIAAALLIFILYGQVIVIAPIPGLLILFLYVLIILFLGWLRADRLYGLNDNIISAVDASPNSKKSRVLAFVTRFIPSPYKDLSRSIIKASLRDVEHISRLSIGVAITVFMLFSLSSRGLFRGVDNFPANIELAVVIFSLVLSSASVVFIETSTFTIQHRDMFSIIKSAPSGAKKFVISKAIQMFYFTVPIFLALIIILGQLGFISSENRLIVMLSMAAILMTLICSSLAIYLINPVDNPEDLNNFINLLFFYIFSFILAIAPVYAVIRYETIPVGLVVAYFLSLLLISIISLGLAIKSLDRMDLETLDSPFSRGILQLVKSSIFLLVIWNFLPLLSLQYLLLTGNVTGFIIFSSILTLLVPIIFWVKKYIKRPRFGIKRQDLWILPAIFPIMMGVGYLLSGFTSIQSFSLTPILAEISRGNLIIVVAFMVLIEELVFRGFIFDFSRRDLSSRKTVLLTAFLFAITHFLSFISFFNSFLQGLILGWVRWKTDSISIPLILHLLYNFLIIVILLY